MTVAELIAALSEFPAETRVLVRGFDGEGFVEAAVSGLVSVKARQRTGHADFDEAREGEPVLFRGLLVD